MGQWKLFEWVLFYMVLCLLNFTLAFLFACALEWETHSVSLLTIEPAWNNKALQPEVIKESPCDYQGAVCLLGWATLLSGIFHRAMSTVLQVKFIAEL